MQFYYAFLLLYQVNLLVQDGFVFFEVFVDVFRFLFQYQVAGTRLKRKHAVCVLFFGILANNQEFCPSDVELHFLLGPFVVFDVEVLVEQFSESHFENEVLKSLQILDDDFELELVDVVVGDAFVVEQGGPGVQVDGHETVKILLLDLGAVEVFLHQEMVVEYLQTHVDVLLAGVRHWDQ